MPVTRSTSTPGYTFWYTGEHGADPWEAHWIEFLLKEDEDRLNRTNVLVVNSWDKWRPAVDCLEDHRNWIFVTVDEQNRIKPQVFTRFLFSLRIGFASREYGSNVITVPLNVPQLFLHAVGKETRVNDDRRYIWSFVGDGQKQDRPEMLRNLKALQPHFLHTYDGWNVPNALKPADYARILSDSIFAPSPSGNMHAECYRTYEALHCGAVPIVTTRYYEKHFEAPFPVADNWQEACSLMEALRHDENRLARIREACLDWYKDMPDVFRRRVAGALRTARQV
jgi:hypothetical protein